MGLQFCFGPSGSGKSRMLYGEITRRAAEEPGRNFLLIVPEQFSMQAQKELVLMNSRGGILNIDVLSFGRLGHRILEEVGGDRVPVLDDTGKSLVLQKVAADLKDRLPVLGGFLHRQGYIHEVKSAISEFMQYGIREEEMEKLIACAEHRGALAGKLRDLQTLYRGFREYIEGRFIANEETLDVLCRALPKSRLLPGSVAVFDGFTGFTPLQARVIGGLMRACDEVIVALTLGEGEDPYKKGEEQDLFHLTKKAVSDLGRLASSLSVERSRDVFVLPEAGRRFREAPALGHLERNLFRYSAEPYAQDQQEIRLFETTDPKEEVRQTGLEILRLVREEGMAFRDMAVILGDMAGYAPYVETEFAQMGILCYLDRTRGIALNPMIEFIKSALALYEKDFAYEAVFHYLRSGLADLGWEEVDRLENYCLRTGVRGRRAYSRPFTRKPPEMAEEALAELNALRERMMAQVEMLRPKGKEAVKDYVNRLYDFLVANRVEQKLAAYQRRFEEAGELVRAMEYAQIFRLVMELLDQIYALLGEEELPLKEFAEILEAGFGEIQVGTIPQNVDRVLVGDMERTRLQQVKALFFLGVNDGNIPRGASRGGIISDMDREFLRESPLELAPSPRQQMYVQRFYLYLNMTKPSRRLYLSYSKVDSAGKSLRPAYLVETVRRLFPGLAVDYPQRRGILEQVVTGQEGAKYLAEGLREYAEGVLSPEGAEAFFTLYQAYGEEKLRGKRNLLTEAAFRRYRDTGLSVAVARALYGIQLENSVTRLETYAACAYRHFLQYGLSLRERQEFSFERVDMGNVYHAVLEQFAGKLEEHGYTWFDFPREFAESCVREALEGAAAEYGGTVLYSSARNEYAIVRMARILTRTVLVLQRQLRRGSFVPESFELSFRHAEGLKSVDVALSEGERMRLQGRIDRIDIAEQEEKVYVKVIDYKSGNKKFDLASLYYGLQLQLAVYMNAAAEAEAGRHAGKEIVPAALLYYRIDDPTVETPVELAPEEIEEEIGRQLRMSGVVNSAPGIAELLDREIKDRSDIIPVERKKGGGFTARSSVLSGEELQVVSAYVSRKIAEIGREILAGRISLNPYEKGNEEACTYCAYRKVCGFEPAMPGCGKRKLEDMDREEALRRMGEEMGADSCTARKF